MSDVLLVAEGLYKRYGAIEACRDISFEIEEGEALAIVGEFGSGKTTLLHLIAGLAAPDAGESAIACATAPFATSPRCPKPSGGP